MASRKFLDTEGLSYFWRKVKDFVAEKVGVKYTKPANGIPASDLAPGVIPIVPVISTDITTDASSDTKTASPKAVKNYVDAHGMDILDLEQESGQLTQDQQALLLSDHCIVRHDGKNYYKHDSETYIAIGESRTLDSQTTYKMTFGNAIYMFVSYEDSRPAVNPDTLETPTHKLEKLQIGYGTYRIPQGEPTPVVDASSQAPSTMEPNKLYKYGTLSGNTVFPPFATPTDLTIANVYWWKFTTPSTAPTITLPAGITEWAGGQAPNIDASTTYEITVEDGFAAYIKS